jgi:outer membrane receptor protein involved in Fe transport
MKTFRHGRPYLRVIAGAFASVAASPACAQIDSKDDQPPIQAMATHWAAASEAASHEQPIIATGSRIARTDSSAPAPLIIVQDEELRLSGAGNVEFLLNKLPQFVPDLDAFFNNGGDGTVRLNLRGLGASRTLTLVDGRRWIPSDTTELVDINTIPTFLLDSVEILTGGGSAVYGPGAIAGVVNFRHAHRHRSRRGSTTAFRARFHAIAAHRRPATGGQCSRRGRRGAVAVQPLHDWDDTSIWSSTAGGICQAECIRPPGSGRRSRVSE